MMNGFPLKTLNENDREEFQTQRTSLQAIKVLENSCSIIVIFTEQAFKQMR